MNIRNWFNNLLKPGNLIALGFLIVISFGVFQVTKNNQTITAKNSDLNNVSQSNSITIFGVDSNIHAEAVKQAEEAKKQVERIIRDGGNLSDEEKLILEEIKLEQKKGNNESAIKLIQKLKRYRQIGLAEIYVLEGRELFAQLQVKEAQEAIEEAIKLDSNNPKYLLTLADYLQWNGKYQRMEEVSQEAILLIENQEPIDEILLSKSLSNLGGAYLFGGQYDLAVSLFEQSLELYKKLLGEEHTSVATSLNNLAVLYSCQERYSEAKPLYEKALEISEATLGVDHPNTKNFRQSLQKNLDAMNKQR